jgi:hypothetical protein
MPPPHTAPSSAGAAIGPATDRSGPGNRTTVPCDELPIGGPAYHRVLQRGALRDHGADRGTIELVASIDTFSNNLYAWQVLLRG